MTSGDSFEWQRIVSLINLLGDNNYKSGEELGNQLEISRAGIWKYIKKIEQLGISVESVKGKGYRLTKKLSLLTNQKIKNSLTADVLANISSLDLFPTIDSTNNYLLGLQNIQGKVCLAEQQTAGRGRRGREWVSPFAQNIYLSIGWCFESGIAAVKGLSLAVGIAIAKALREHQIENLNFKWPNDLVVPCENEQGYKKLAGILIELRGDISGACEIIVGVGMNYQMTSSEITSIGQPWIDLNSISAENLPERNKLVASLINNIVSLLKDFEQKTFAYYRKEWESLNVHYQQTIVVSQGDETIEGKFFGLNDEGALVLLTSTGKKMLFNGGEVSLRKLA